MRRCFQCTNDREPTFRVDMSHFFFIKTHVPRFVCIHIETNATCCLLQIIQQGVGLGRCIYKKCFVICVLYVRNTFCRVSSASCLFCYKAIFLWQCPWCNGYRRRKWTRWHEFKSWTRLSAFHIALIPLGKVWIQLFSLQLWVNSRTDWVL